MLQSILWSGFCLFNMFLFAILYSVFLFIDDEDYDIVIVKMHNGHDEHDEWDNIYIYT